MRQGGELGHRSFTLSVEWTSRDFAMARFADTQGMRSLLTLSLLCACGGPPAVAFTAPTADVTTRGTVTLQFLVEGSPSLDVFVDEVRFATLQAPFTLALDTRSLTEGQHRVEGRTQGASSGVRTITVDRTAPRVVRRAPQGVTAPALRVPFEVEFDEPLARASVRSDSARLLGPAGAVDSTVTLSADGQRITLGYRGVRPSARLPLTVSIDGVTDLAGNVASADQFVVDLLPFQRLALPDGRFPERLVVDASGRPWVVSTTASMTQVVDVWRDGRWEDGRAGVAATARITDLRATPDGVLELAAVDGAETVLMTRAPDTTTWQFSSRGPATFEVRLTSRSDQPAVLQTPQGVRLASLVSGGLTLSEPVQVNRQFQVVLSSEGPVTVATFDGMTLSLHRTRGQRWESADLALASVSNPQVLRGRTDDSFRVIGVDTTTSKLVAFDLGASFGAPGTALRQSDWSAATPAGEAVLAAAFPALNRDLIDTGDLGGRGFVVTRNDAFISVWAYGWETYRQVLFSEPTPVTRVPAGEYSAILADSRWFTSDAGELHRHGVIVQRFEGPRLSSDLYLPND